MADHLTTLKILIIGESGVGKTSLLLRFVDDHFDPEQTLTIGMDFKAKNITINGDTVRLAIWDTAGQERFRTISPMYYRDVQGAILVFDVNSYGTFAKLDTWLNELETYSTRGNFIKMIVGNKIDMDNREVTKEEATRFARKHQALYLETSAKTRHGVQMAFEELVQKIMETPSLWDTPESDGIRIGLKDHEPEQSCSSSLVNLIFYPYWYFTKPSITE